MRILLVSEGKHELGGALETLVRKLVPGITECVGRDVRDTAFHVHGGKGPGMLKKAIRCVIVAEREGFDACAFVIDEDGDAPRRRQLAEAQEHTSISALPRAIGIAIRTFDAWMLADERALTVVLGVPVQRQPDPESIRQPKDLCARLRDCGTNSLGLAELYAALAREIDPDVLARRCPDGFGEFASRAAQLRRPER